MSRQNSKNSALSTLSGSGRCDLSGTSLQWVRSYLVGREQVVHVEGTLSSPLKLTCGVPQGSILGPLFFFLYVNDMPSAIDCNLFLFADNSAILVTHKEKPEVYVLVHVLCVCRPCFSPWPFLNTENAFYVLVYLEVRTSVYVCVCVCVCVCVHAFIHATRISFPLYSFKIFQYYFKMKEAGVLFDIISLYCFSSICLHKAVKHSEQS